MRCPVCNGRGRVRRRFLLFFTRRAKCAHCLGTGEFPPPLVERRRDAPGYIRDDEPIDRRSSSTTESRDRDNNFEVGSGGRSGGGGGGASWGSGEDKSAPVIVDPFAADRSSALAGASAVAASSAGDDSGPSGDGDSSTGSSGTSY